MRRKDREVTGEAALTDILARGGVASIAFGGDTPYVIPMNYGFEVKGGRFTLYLHGAKEGEKIRRIRADARAAFTVYTGNHIYGGDAACMYSTSFDSVCGSGLLRIAEGGEKLHGLQRIMAHYAPGKELPFAPEMVDAVCVMALDVQAITGKHHD
ncbi:MAG: pyridoxamine 5'-phosphate oxidase family protein [Clostridia bacterium]|nr:pyridoxamine 5'-phosphate oxidase family protein [Clostridia bacterium]